MGRTVNLELVCRSVEHARVNAISSSRKCFLFKKLLLYWEGALSQDIHSHSKRLNEPGITYVCCFVFKSPTDPPYISKAKNTGVSVGQKGILSCEASAVPMAEFQWFKEDTRYLGMEYSQLWCRAEGSFLKGRRMIQRKDEAKQEFLQLPS